ncbi:hypothetical protein IT568_09210 [bacterium]|nr:hypothetical protein [bacterium]
MKIEKLSILVVLLSFQLSFSADLFPLYPVDAGGNQTAQVALLTDYFTYLTNVSIKNYPRPMDLRTPESVVANMVRVILENDFKQFRELFDPSQKDLIAQQNFDYYRQMFAGVTDIVYVDRYKAGSFVIISYKFVFAPNEESLLGLDGWGTMLRMVNNQFYFLRAMSFDDPILAAVGLDMSNKGLNFKSKLANSYQYKVKVPASLSGDDPNAFPMEIHFNGSLGRIPVKEGMPIKDEIDRFMQKVVLNYRSGSDKKWLELWDGKEKLDRESLLTTSDGKDAFYQESERFNADPTYQIFKIDFGKNALVYYQNVDLNCSGVGLLTYYKNEKTGNYYLTQQNDFEFSETELFNDNLRILFSSKFFIDYVTSLIDPLQEEILVTPRELVLSKSAKGNSVVKLSTCTGRTKNFELTKILAPDPSINVIKNKLVSNGYQLTLENVKVDEKLNGKTLEISTNVASMPKISIPIRVVQ